MRPFGFARSSLLAALGALACATAGCSTYRDELARSQHAFDENQHERALAILRMLELDTSHLDADEHVRYAYLRGMTDFRIGYKADARHWLAVAKAMDEQRPGLLSEEWRTRLDQSLAELDAQVWTAGMESLTVTASAERKRAAKHKPPPKKVVAKPEEEEEEEAPPKPSKKKPAAADEDE